MRPRQEVANLAEGSGKADRCVLVLDDSLDSWIVLAHCCLPDLGGRTSVMSNSTHQKE